MLLQNNSRNYHRCINNALMKLLLLTILICFINPAYTQVNTADFESGTLSSDWKKHSSGSKFSGTITSSRACNGSYSLKTKLTYPPAYRSEVVYTKRPFNKLQHGKEYWLGLAIYLEGPWPSDGKKSESLLNIHHRPDKHRGEPGGGNAPLSLKTRNGQWLIMARTEKEKLCGNCEKSVALKSIGAYKTNAWTEFVFNVKFTHTNSGFLKVWKDGKLAFNYSGPIGYNNEVGPYIKMGVFKPSWKTGGSKIKNRTAYHDRFRIKQGSGSPADVAPNCGKNNKNIEKLSPPSKLKIIQK